MTTSKAAGGKSMLDSMASGFMANKQTAARGLTPLRGDAPAGLPNDLPGQFMSNEKLAETSLDLRARAATLIEIADAIDLMTGPVFGLTDGAEAPERKPGKIEQRMAGVEPEPSPIAIGLEEDMTADANGRITTADPVEQPRVNAKATALAGMIEAPGTALPNMEEPVDFNARFAAQQAAAQAAAFKAPDSTVDGGEDPAPTGWRCPNHPTLTPTIRTSTRRNRQFRACPEGDDYEKL